MYVLRKVLNRKVLIYLNDILIINKSKEEHKKIMIRVHKLLIETDLYKKKEKYRYFQNRIKFLDFILTEEKVKKDSKKLKCI